MTRDDDVTSTSTGFRPDPRAIEAGLHLVSTPIGAARDITLRALDVLAKADVLAAEDTRTLRHLMEIHGVALNGRRVIAYHDHNGESARPLILRHLQEGKSVAYASEADTPLVADPGFQLARAAIAEGLTVRAAPGASAVLTALAVGGLPTDRFLFAGFLPATQTARKRAISELAPVAATLVFYESPKRVSDTLRDLCEVLGEDREAVLCRELTKRFEESRRGHLGALRDALKDETPKGECVILVGRAAEVVVDAATLDEALIAALPGRRVKEVAHEVALRLGVSKRDAYQAALRLSEEMKPEGDER